MFRRAGMCLIVFAWQTHPDFPLILGANRDEFLDRPAEVAAFWTDHPYLLAGRDLSKGGTWLGITSAGRVAAVTNYRQGSGGSSQVHSRGLLVAGFLTDNRAPAAYLADVAAKRDAYDGFSLLAGDGDTLFYFSNRGGDPQPVPCGVHGLSNAFLDTAWPKVERAKSALAALLDRPEAPLVAGILALLADRTRPEDAKLPSTGVSLEWERCLSPVFITAPTYGTRCSTVLLVGRTGRVTFVERSFNHATGVEADVTYRFNLARGARAPSHKSI